MKYVITFEDYDYGATSVVIDSYCMERAIIEAQNKTGYADSDVLSAVRVG